MTKLECDFQEKFKRWIKNSREVVIAGIGNPIRSDDFIGVKIVQDLKNKVHKRVKLFECETVPESFLEPIIELNPTHIILIDAAYLGLKPGNNKLIKPEQIINFSSITSHILPLRVFCEFIKKTTNAKIILLLIEPKNTDFGEELSSEIQESSEQLVKFLIKMLKK